MKQLLILLFCVMMLASCSKDKENTNTSNIESLSDDLDTAELEKDEMFGAVLTNDFLGMEDEDLETYLITQIYPLVSASKKVTIDRASASDFVVTYDEAGYTKRMLIKKYYNPLTEEVFFERSEYTKTE
jgi:hypothetical protein